MAALRFGPARLPSRESPEDAVATLVERGFTAAEVDLAGGFWMDYEWAERLGELARDAGIALSRVLAVTAIESGRGTQA